MRASKYKVLLEPLLKKALFNANDARELGIPSRMLSYFCQKGLIERSSRGIYRVVDAYTGINWNIEELVLTAFSVPRGVICLISALYYYNLTDQIMREYWIAVPNADMSPKRPHIRVVRMRNITLGQVSVKIGKYEVKIFERERTIIDAFRYLSHEIAIKALQAYLMPSKDYKPDLVKLAKYAKILRINITPYIMALTT